MRLLAILGLLAAVSGEAAAGYCYSLYDAKNQLVLQSTQAPIDTSRSISEETQRLFPGHYLVIGDVTGCVEVDEIGKVSRIPLENPALALARPVQKFDDVDAGILELGAYPPRAGSRRLAGTDVQVKSYVKRDGTVVHSHTRAAPGRGR